MNIIISYILSKFRIINISLEVIMNKSNITKSQKKSELLPRYGSKQREILFDLMYGSPAYQKGPFFKKEDLERLEIKYKSGISWNEICQELEKNKMLLNKATFRKYIQDNKIASAISYRKTKTKTGREALYPANTIRHINFIQAYYKIFDKKKIQKFILKVLEIIEKGGFSAYDVIQDYLYMEDPLNRVWYYIKGISFPDEPDISEIIKDVFDDDPDFRDEILMELDKFVDKFLTDYVKWIEKLKNHKASLLQSLSITSK